MKEYTVEYGIDDVCELGNIIGRPNCIKCPHLNKIKNNIFVVGPKGSYESMTIVCNYEGKSNNIQ